MSRTSPLWQKFYLDLLLYGHAVMRGSFHQVNNPGGRMGVVHIYKVGTTCLHCGEVVE